MIHYDTLLRIATDIITIWASYFITKCGRSLLENASGILLQNATVLLQNATVITNCDDFITKCDSYHKIRRLLQIATVQTEIRSSFDVFLIVKTYRALLFHRVYHTLYMFLLFLILSQSSTEVSCKKIKIYTFSAEVLTWFQN